MGDGGELVAENLEEFSHMIAIQYLFNKREDNKVDADILV